MPIIDYCKEEEEGVENCVKVEEGVGEGGRSDLSVSSKTKVVLIGTNESWPLVVGREDLSDSLNYDRVASF